MDIVKLNVSGKRYEVPKITLSSFSGYFSELLNKYIQVDEIFEPRSPHIFNHVLGLMYDPEYPFPLKYKSELKFYDVTVVDVQYYDQDQYKFKILNNIDKNLETINININDIHYGSKDYNSLYSICEDVEAIKNALEQ